MPKKKKTRKQKALTDIKRKTEPKTIHTATFEKPTQTRHIPLASPKEPSVLPSTPPSRPVLIKDYTYVAGDLRKTLFLTAAIIVVELGIKFGTGI